MENGYGRQPAGANRSARPAGKPSGQQQRAQQGRSASGQRQPSAPQQPQRRTPPPQKKKSESRWFRAIIMVICTVALCGFLALFLLQSANDLFGLNQEDKMIVVTGPDDPTISQIATILSDSGVIDSKITFRLYAMLKKDEQYYGGDYRFNSNMGFDELLRELRTKSSNTEIVTLYFVEGRNVYEIAKLLEEYKVCKANAFLEHLETADFGYEFMDQLPEDARRFRRLEGYIFPDTYDFYVGDSVDNVARKFLGNFSKKITTQMTNRMRDLNLTLDQTITLASMIEKEVGGVNGSAEMERVSSVFHNRLNLPEVYSKLQSDVTREYVNRFIIPFHDIRNQDMYDAYNTYECDGLPVGPISNPGQDAIMAALYPATTDYYFFVTDVQGNFYYAETAEEHYQNIREASKVEGEGEIHGIDMD